MPTWSPLVRAAALALLGAASGCASLSPRFPLEISTSFAQEPMRKLETESLELYYPAASQKQAHAVVERLEGCFRRLSALPVTKAKRERAVVYMTGADFNNAYVSFPIAGNPRLMVLPTHMSLELFNLLELGLTAIGDVSCHEAVHYVQMQQTDGFWGGANDLFGDYMTPGIFLESWFAEGLATYYEARLGKRTGRPESPIWRAMFEAGTASRGGALQGGDLNPASREMLPFGGPYLMGSYFIDYLVRTHGEQKLWELIDVQGRSIFSPFWVSLRFAAVYGKSLDELFDDYSRELRKTVKPRKRPGSQKVMEGEMGYIARLASGRADGALASVSARRDQELQLEVREPDGRLRFARGVTPIWPGRPFVSAHPLVVSGLSFSPDGRALYLVVGDVAMDGNTETRLVQLDARSGELVRTWDGFTALGGDVTADGKGYVLVEVADERSNLVRLDLATGERTPLTHFEGQESLGAPAVSPDGRRVAFARWMEEGFEIHLVDEDGQVRRLTTNDVFDYSPRWLDDDRLLLVHEHDGRPQVGVVRVSSGALEVISDVPYAALDPSVTGGGTKVAFLNREAWSWTLDTAPLPGPEETTAPAGDDVAESLPAPAPETAPSPPAVAEAARPAAITRDEPYRQGEHLFRPNLHVPWIQPEVMLVPGTFGGPAQTRWGVAGGLSLQGSDRLGLHNWALNASYDTLYRGPSVGFGYGTSLAAPWWLQATASYSSSVTPVGTPLGTLEDELQESARFSALAARTFWTTPLSLSFDAISYGVGPTSGTRPIHLFVVGPQLSASYAATAGTANGGTRTGLVLSGFAAGYPSFLGGSVNMADLGGSLAVWVPLPFTTRHTLRLVGRARVLPGAPAGLLRVGGLGSAGAGTTWTADPDRVPSTPSGPSLPGVSFAEPLRGYEDHGFRGTWAAIGGARYRLSFPIDLGTVSTFYLLPSFFLQQVDVEAFAEGAYMDDARRTHLAGGAALLVRTRLGGALPLTLKYQYANRFGAAPAAHFFGVALE